MASEPVIIKGVRDGMLILLSDAVDWTSLLADLRTRFEERSSFFRGASVTINLGNRSIGDPEWNQLDELLKEHEMELAVVVSASDQSRAVADAHGARNRSPAFAQQGDTVAEMVAAAGIEPAPESPGRLGKAARRGERRKQQSKAQNGAAVLEADLATVPLTADGEPDFLAFAGDAEALPEEVEIGFGSEDQMAGPLFLRRTLRSGMFIRHAGDVCVLGDVNAGAMIEAGGDILVWGTLRGMVHAGVGGDSAAVVGALLLAPTQLSIGNVRSRGPSEGPANNGRALPEMAYIEGDRIAVKDWSDWRRTSQ